MRIMALDVGSKTIGVAVSDELLMTAQGKSVIQRKSIEQDIQELTLFIQEYQVSKLIVGFPKNMDGSMGEMSEQIIEFVDELQNRIDIQVELVDERLTTKLAERTLLEADLSRKKRKQVIDKLAAVHILQTYLDRRLS